MMAEKGLDDIHLPVSSLQDEDRQNDVETILRSLQILAIHVQYLEHELVLENQIHKKNEKPLDLGLIRHQMWLSVAFQKIKAAGQELEWKRFDCNSPGEDNQLPSEAKSILDQSLNEGLAVPLEPERVWTTGTDTHGRLLSWTHSQAMKQHPDCNSPRILMLVEPDHVDLDVDDIKKEITTTDSKNQFDIMEFKKKIKDLQNKLEKKGMEITKDPVAYDAKANVVDGNLRSLEDNINKLKSIFGRLEIEIEVTPTNYVAMKDYHEKEIMFLKRLTANLKDEIPSKICQHENFKHTTISQEDKLKSKMSDMKLWYDLYLGGKWIFQEQKVRALRTILKMNKEADDICGQMKKQFDGYATQLEASKKEFEDALTEQMSLKQRRHKLTESNRLEDAVEIQPCTLFETEDNYLSRHMFSVAVGLTRRARYSIPSYIYL